MSYKDYRLDNLNQQKDVDQHLKAIPKLARGRGRGRGWRGPGVVNNYYKYMSIQNSP